MSPPDMPSVKLFGSVKYLSLAPFTALRHPHHPKINFLESLLPFFFLFGRRQLQPVDYTFPTRAIRVDYLTSSIPLLS